MVNDGPARSSSRIHAQARHIRDCKLQHRKAMSPCQYRLGLQRRLRSRDKIDARQIQGLPHNHRSAQVANVHRIEGTTQKTHGPSLHPSARRSLANVAIPSHNVFLRGEALKTDGTSGVELAG